MRYILPDSVYFSDALLSKEQKKVTTANILIYLRGALNYPLEESCYREHIRVHDISFLSSERVFADERWQGLRSNTVS